MREQDTQWPVNVNVWKCWGTILLHCAVHRGRNLKWTSLLAATSNRILTTVLDDCEDQEIYFNSIWYYQSDAPPNYHRDVKLFKFDFPKQKREEALLSGQQYHGSKCISYFLFHWEYLKLMVYTNRHLD